MATLSQFVPNGSAQDNQWADPSLASPLAALSHYLTGISAVGLNGAGTSGGAEGGNGQAPWGELYSTSAYDPNTSNVDSGNQALQAALATAQKYDPKASLEYYDPTAGSEGGSSTPMVRIDMDQALLPKAPQLPGGTQLLSNVRTANNQTPDAGQGPHLYDQSAVAMDPNWGPITVRQNVKPEADKLTDVGFWGPLVTSAIIGGAGMGMLPGFGGMSNAAAQGLVSGATGSGLAPGTASIFGMSGSKIPNTFLSIGRNLTSGKPDFSSLGSLGLSLGMNGLGMGNLTSLANLALGAAQGGKVNPLTALMALSRLSGGLGGK